MWFLISVLIGPLFSSWANSLVTGATLGVLAMMAMHNSFEAIQVDAPGMAYFVTFLAPVIGTSIGTGLRRLGAQDFRRAQAEKARASKSPSDTR